MKNKDKNTTEQNATDKNTADKSTTPISAAIAKKIKELREFKKLKQGHVAHSLGISQQTYSKIEQGSVELTISRVHEIAKVLKVSPADLMILDKKHIDALKIPELDIQKYSSNIEFETYITTIKRQRKMIEDLETELNYWRSKFD
jgi:transcriptional regulator with XRE-family HTH domain